MAPSLIPADFLSKRSTNDSNIILFIISVIVGGLSVITAAIILFVVLKRRANSVPRHSRNLSDTSAASLLQPEPQWRKESFTPPHSPLDHSPIPSDRIHRNDSTDSLATIIPSQDQKVEPQSREATPLLSSDLPALKPTLPSLFIPSHSPRIPKVASSPGSASSESLYSQPSASASHVATSPLEQKFSLPRSLPQMVPQYAHIRPDTDVPTRADTRKIGNLLKERAKRNERKPTRNISRIERAGSIKPAFDSDASDDDSESVHRPRRSKINRSSAAALVQQGTSEEWSNIALAAR